ncbi:MAG: hypothetical protein H0X37_00060 [Herpetosiphonaceae bacterium]|nr:hypothetical protein [Herpetosiphonaceae bacterium]
MSGIFGSTILEVAIGLFFTYFLLSIICSSVNEVIAAVVKLRASHLENGIAHLLRDPALAQAVLQHPLVRMLDTPSGASGWVRRITGWYSGARQTGFPSYVPARAFSLALFDALAPVAQGPVTVQRLRQAALERALAGTPAGSIPDTGTASPSMTGRGNLERRAFGILLLNLIDASQKSDTILMSVDHIKMLIDHLPANTDEERQIKNALAAAALQAGSLGVLRRRLLLVPDSPARQTVLNIVSAAEGDIEAVRQSVETWFDQAMNRVSGIYKRRVQTILILLAIFISFGLGIDTVRLSTTLAENTALRAALVNEATRVTAVNTASGNGSSAGATSELSTVVADIKGLNLPIGYDDYPRFQQGSSVSQPTSEWLAWGGKKFLGLLATTFAITMGAPFWFDVLMKVANLRTSGPPPAKSGAEKKD